MSEAPAVLVDTNDHVMTITLNRPEARNSINAEVARLVGDAFESATNDPNVRVIILTGTGDKAFCAGADLKAIARGEKITPPELAKYGFGGIVKRVLSKPIIAAINGPALGGGTEMALMCDLIVSSEDATFGLPEVKRGIIAAAGGVLRLMDNMPRKRAMEMLLTGDPITAREALELNLINQVVPQTDVLKAALALAERIKVNAPLAVQSTKRVAMGIDGDVVVPEVEKWRINDQEYPLVMATEDAKEGPRAFAEKRPAVWQAR